MQCSEHCLCVRMITLFAKLIMLDFRPLQM